MRNPKIVPVILLLAALAGCAGSGGGGDSGMTVEVNGQTRNMRPSDGSRPFTAAELALCIATMFLVCGYWDDEHAGTVRAVQTTSLDSGSAHVPYEPTPFTSWSDRIGQPSAILQAAGLETVVAYDADGGTIRATAAPAFDVGAKAVVREWHAEYLENFFSRDFELHGYGKPGVFVFPERPEMEIMRAFGHQPQTVFADESHQSIGLMANPYALGWDYQSFGAWSNARDPAAMSMGATSFGAPTPAGSVPTSGAAEFTGKLAGLYVSPDGAGAMAAADLVVSTNFTTRSLSIASSGTALARDITTSTAAPHLDVSGTLTYSPGANAFAGTLVNAGGTMSGTSNGQFYGPAAQELGGVFTLKSATTAETFVGAYGAKR